MCNRVGTEDNLVWPGVHEDVFTYPRGPGEEYKSFCL